MSILFILVSLQMTDSSGGNTLSTTQSAPMPTQQCEAAVRNMDKMKQDILASERAKTGGWCISIDR